MRSFRIKVKNKMRLLDTVGQGKKSIKIQLQKKERVKMTLKEKLLFKAEMTALTYGESLGRKKLVMEHIYGFNGKEKLNESGIILTLNIEQQNLRKLRTKIERDILSNVELYKKF